MAWDFGGIADPVIGQIVPSRIYGTDMLLKYLVAVVHLGRALADQKPFWIEDESHSTQYNPFAVEGDKDDEFVTEYAGITTFAHLPFINCLHPTYTEEAKEKFDIAIVGAPFDTSVTYRPGARFGPTGIRLGSRRLSKGFNTDSETGFNALNDWATIVDCGDAALTPFDNRIALSQIKHSHQKITKFATPSSKNGTIPRIITLGGDHTITLPALRAIHSNFGKVAVLHFDSHLDTWSPEVLSHNQSSYAAINHGTFLHIAHEEGLLVDGKNMHAGIRTQLESLGDIKNDRRCGFDIVFANDIDRVGIQGVINRIKARIGDEKVYISVDIDVLDPAYAPATGTPEIGGWTTRELIQILKGLAGVNVVGADVVEVAPVYDTQAELTGLAAAGVVETLIELMVKRPVGHLEERQ